METKSTHAGNAPYGSIQINSEKCTFCLACINLCPTGALTENQQPPQILFQANNCAQCGLCVTGCPENVIRLLPRFGKEPHPQPQILHQAEPFICIECGAEFGIKSTIKKIISMLESKNAAFDHSANTRLICMCDPCKLKARHPLL